MKKIIMLICILSLTACASYNMKYVIPQGKTRASFEQQKQDCGFDRVGGSGFIFGPAVIVLPVMAVYGIAKEHQYQTFQECMEAAGYRCVSDCPIVR